MRSEEPLLPTQAWQSPSSSVAQRCRQMPGQHSLNGTRWQCWCHCPCYCEVTAEWKCLYFILSDLIHPVLLFLAPLSGNQALSSFSSISSPRYYINANAGFCPLFIILWRFVVVFDTDSLLQIYSDNCKLGKTKFNTVNQNNTIWIHQNWVFFLVDHFVIW